jgi:hypothetical protein
MRLRERHISSDRSRVLVIQNDGDHHDEVSECNGEQRDAWKGKLRWKAVVPEQSLAASSISLGKGIWQLFKETFLPAGYPNSVRPEYLEYQMWDSLQGISSYLRGVLTTKALLVGAGVGNFEANALTSALIWVSRDGIGMIGSLVLAYMCADAFEIDVKEWRLFADFLNNFALTLDLLAGVEVVLSNRWYYFLLVALSTLVKSCCWLIASATKARISAHFARNGHLADVTAKESTQETGIALVGLILGMICAKLIDENMPITWGVFVILLVLHQWANYKLIRVLVLDTLNPQRIYLITAENMGTDSDSKPSGLTPESAARKETLLRPISMWVWGPRLGVSLDVILNALPNDPSLLSSLLELWKDEEFIVGYDRYDRAVVCLRENVCEDSIVKAYFIASFLQMQSSQYANRNGIHEKYVRLLSSSAPNGRQSTGGGKQALKWFDRRISPFLYPTTGSQSKRTRHSIGSNKVTEPVSSGWNVSANSTRLSVGPWRYCSTHDS